MLATKSKNLGASWPQGFFSKVKPCHLKDHVAISHLTKYDAFRTNRDQAMNLEICFKIHTDVSNFETASLKTI